MCGSNGVSYDNHCYLHKAACDSDKHISPAHSGFCRWDTFLKLNHFCNSCMTKVFCVIVERDSFGQDLLCLVTPCYEFFASQRILKSLQKTFQVHSPQMRVWHQASGFNTQHSEAKSFRFGYWNENVRLPIDNNADWLWRFWCHHVRQSFPKSVLI